MEVGTSKIIGSTTIYSETMQTKTQKGTIHKATKYFAFKLIHKEKANDL